MAPDDGLDQIIVNIFDQIIVDIFDQFIVNILHIIISSDISDLETDLLGGVLTLGLQDGDADPLLLRLALHLAHRLRPHLAVPPCDGEALLERPHRALQLLLGLACGDLLGAAVLHLQTNIFRWSGGKRPKRKVEQLVKKEKKKR